MIEIRAATAADRWTIRFMVWRAGLVPTGLDWRRFLVACDDAGIVGCVQVRRHHDGPELSSLVTARAWRGRGVATQLVNALLLQEAGELHLMCAESLRAFYARFGFVELAQTDAMPAALRRKRAAARLFGLPIICMRRPARRDA